jgi:hypothetical protein
MKPLTDYCEMTTVISKVLGVLCKLRVQYLGKQHGLNASSIANHLVVFKAGKL